MPRVIALLVTLMSVVASPLAAIETSLELKVVGKITERCAISVANGAELDFSSRLENVATLSIDCNTPMALSINSQYGALALFDGSQAIQSMAGAGVRETDQTYIARLAISSLNFQGLATSAELKDGVIFRTGPHIPFTTDAQLTVTLDSPLIYAGRYQDTLHIEVSPDQSIGGI